MKKIFLYRIPVFLTALLVFVCSFAVPVYAAGVDASTGEITDTWEEIGQYVASGEYKTRYSLGNYKTITLSDGTVLEMQIVAFDADVKADGSGKAAITWISKCIVTTHNMNSTSTNEGGWEASEMRTWLQGDFYPSLPDDVKDVIVSVNKTYGDYNGGAYTTNTCVDNVWIPSMYEIFGAGYDSYGVEEIGADYTGFFIDNASRIKYKSGSSLASRWWLRSAGIDSSSFFRVVHSSGSVNNRNSADTDGVVVGFCTYASPPPDPTAILIDALSVFSASGSWLVGALADAIEMFYCNGSLTFLGYLAVAALAISVVFLFIAVISRFLKFGG